MIKIERFVFNPFQENTYLLYDETSEAVLIDPGCSDTREEQKLKKFIEDHQIKLIAQIYTHTHIDHVLGGAFIFNQYGLRPLIHRDALPFLLASEEQGKMYGMEIDEIIEPEEFFDEGDEIKFGNSVLRVIHTPGHVDGHVCFVNEEQKFVVVGDVLFRDSIGRTDLPSGDFETLSHSIRYKLFTLDDDFAVYPGHGPSTTIGYEIMNNPFINGR